MVLGASLSFAASVADVSLRATVSTPDLPLSAHDSATASVQVVEAGPDAQRVLVALMRGERLRLPINVGYNSLDGTKWSSQVTYQIVCERTVDRDLLEKILDEANGEAIEGTGAAVAGSGGAVLLKCVAIPGTWTQSEA